MEVNQLFSDEKVSHYESEAILGQYLLFHYGSDQDLMPFSFGPRDCLHFPVRCVKECLNSDSLPPQAKALEIGCAVGRSSFELARYCKSVLAVDNSYAFIAAAKQLQEAGQLEYKIMGEGAAKELRVAKLPACANPDRVEFRCCDAMDIFQTEASYDVVLAANLVCRLPEPLTFLKLLPRLVAENGQLILTTPYSWLEEFTKRSSWIEREDQHSETHPLESLKSALNSSFSLEKAFDLPFLLREHFRKYQWVVSQASVWRRKA